MKGFHMEGNAVKKDLVAFIRQRLAEHGMFISDDSLEYTAERYAHMIAADPNLCVSKLLDEDIVRLIQILHEIRKR